MNFALKSVAIAMATSGSLSVLSAQNCYSNPNQCFSFAPWPTDLDRLDTGLNLRSERLQVTGDIRLRLRTADSKTGTPYNTNDQQATRARVQAKYVVNDNAIALIEYNFSETWAGSDPYSDALAGPNFNGLSQAYLNVEDMLDLNDEWRVGRSTFVLGNGLVLGSCDFLQFPSTFTGVWASTEIEGHNIEVFGFDDYGPLQSPNAGTRFWGATGRLNFAKEDADYIIHYLHGYYLAGTGDGYAINEDSWVGAEAQGMIPGGIRWRAEAAYRSVMGANDVTAYRLRADKTLDLLHGVFNGITFVRTDSEGAMHINPADFNTAGLLHEYGGAWRSDLDTNQLGLSFRPGWDLDLDLNFLTLDRDGRAAQLGRYEVDVMLGKKLKSGVYAWAGYGRDDDDRQVGYFQLTLQF